MLKNIIKDRANRVLVQKEEKKVLFYKYLLNNTTLTYRIRKRALLELKKIKGSKTRISSRCIITGRGRSVLSMYKISRITFRKLASNGLLAGVRKSSW